MNAHLFNYGHIFSRWLKEIKLIVLHARIWIALESQVHALDSKYLANKENLLVRKFLRFNMFSRHCSRRFSDLLCPYRFCTSFWAIFTISIDTYCTLCYQGLHLLLCLTLAIGTILDLKKNQKKKRNEHKRGSALPYSPKYFT